MKIVDIEVTTQKIKLKSPFITALREVCYAEFIRLKILCSDGNFAYGEAPATEAITGETLESISTSIHCIIPLLIAKDLYAALKILHSQKCGSSAKAALDMAIVVLLAKVQKKGLKEYFQIRETSPLETDITISLGSKEQMLLDAKDALEDGMKILKIKLGSDIFHAIGVTKALSQEFPEAKLLIDANQAWTKKNTLFYLQEIDMCTIELIEQPVLASNLQSLKVLTQKSRIPILADEALFTLSDAQEIVNQRAADMFNIKLMKCGGVTKAIEILEYAKQEGIKCMLGSMIEGPYSINITLYLAFAYRDVIQYIDLDSPLLYESFPDVLDFVYSGSLISFKEQSVVSL